MSLPADALSQLDRQLPQPLKNAWGSLAHLSMLGLSQYWRGRRWGGGEWKMTWLKMDEWARKGRLLNLFLFPPSTSSLWWPTYCSDMPAMCDPKQMCGFMSELKTSGRLEILSRFRTDSLPRPFIQTLHNKMLWIWLHTELKFWIWIKYPLKNLTWHAEQN